MNPTAAFLTDITLAVIISVGIVAYVKGHLRTLLIELCGTTERASFWLAFSNVTLVLVPLIFVLDYKPEFGPDKTLIFEMATQLKYAIIGFVIALSALALAMLRYVPRNKSNAARALPQ
jgi:uncharacterized membrane protein YhaH (DUF805 family)